MSRHAAAAAVRVVAPAGLAVIAFLLLALSSLEWVGFAVACLAVLAGAWSGAGSEPYGAGRGGGRGAGEVGGGSRGPGLGEGPRAPLGGGVAPRTLVAAAMLGHAATAYPVAPVTVAGAGLLGVLLTEPLLHRVARPWFRARGLPTPRSLVEDGTGWWVPSAAVLLTGLVSVAGGPGWLLAAPAVGAVGFAGWLAADGAYRWRTRHRQELAGLARSVAGHGPAFLVYFSAPPGSAYQLRMWLPQLDRLGEPFLVVLAERENLAEAAATTGVPVVACDTFEALDAVLATPSLRAAFYVNNGARNAHCVRVTRLTHVQLYHGDSDKAVTASPLNQLYDRVFVAGQAAVDRFAAHGVELAPGRLRIVGRPQVAALQVADRPIGEVTDPTVLYAPTWVGANADSRHCSLPIGESIVAGLLARGVTVVLRPHPYTRRDRTSAAQLRRIEQLLAADRVASGRPHRWGKAATTDLSLFECMDLADAMVCDVSSVASDFLYTGKPYAVTDMAGTGTHPAAYALDGDAGNLAEVLDDLLGKDPRSSERQRLRGYYLGDFPPDRYAEAFLTEARRCLGTAPGPGNDRSPGNDRGLSPDRGAAPDHGAAPDRATGPEGAP